MEKSMHKTSEILYLSFYFSSTIMHLVVKSFNAIYMPQKESLKAFVMMNASYLFTYKSWTFHLFSNI